MANTSLIVGGILAIGAGAYLLANKSESVEETSGSGVGSGGSSPIYNVTVEASEGGNYASQPSSFSSGEKKSSSSSSSSSPSIYDGVKTDNSPYVSDIAKSMATSPSYTIKTSSLPLTSLTVDNTKKSAKINYGVFAIGK